MYVRDSLHTLIGFLKLSWSLFMCYFPCVNEKVGLKLTIHSLLERYQLLPPRFQFPLTPKWVFLSEMRDFRLEWEIHFTY